MATLVGTWKLESNENLDEFLKEMGVNFILRNLAKQAKPTVILKNDNGTWTLTRHTMISTEECTFKSDEEFTETVQKETVKSVVTVESLNKQIHRSQTKYGQVVSIRELTDDDTMTVTMNLTSGNVTCKRVFKREKS